MNKTRRKQIKNETFLAFPRTLLQKSEVIGKENYFFVPTIGSVKDIWL
jgi:hypothetical protein